MLFLLKPRAKWNDPMVGSRTDSSVLVSEKRLKKSNRPRGFETLYYGTKMNNQCFRKN
jgi:hypothetical protein